MPDITNDSNKTKMVAKREPSSKYMSTNPSTKGDADEKENTETKLTFMQRAEATRVKLKKFMAASIFGSVYDYCFLFLSVISAFSFIAVTYLDPRYYKEYDDPYDTNFIALSNSWEPARQALAIFEMVLATMFGFDLCLALYLADHKLELLGSYFFWVDLLTVVPTYATYGSTPPNFDSIDNFRKGLEFVLHAATTARLLRLLRIRKYLRQISDDIRRLLSDMVLIILVTIIFDAGLMQYLEAHAQRLLFHEWMYMFVVTISTVGYGDIAPDTVLGRLVVMLMIIFSIVNIPQMTNTLIEKMKYTSVYTRARYVKKSHTSHLLICGNLRSLSLVDFFSELFHEDHEIDNVQAVILANSPPWHEMQQLLTNPSFSVIITYLQGSAFNEDDLARAHAESALAIFILTDKFSTQPFEQDAKTILQQFSIERYINHRRHFHSAEQGKDESTTPNVPVQFCTEVIRAENRKHLAPADAFDDGNRNVVVCLNEIKMGIIANTILYPGSCAILFNLLNSFADTEDDDVALGTETGEIEYLDDDDEADWIGEYKRGCDWEIYTTAMAGEFSGLRFNTLSYELYMSLGITLFGLQITDLQKGIKEIFINPGDMIVPDPELYYVEGLVIAKNKAESDLSVVGEMGFELNLRRGKQSRSTMLSLAVYDLQQTRLIPNRPRLNSYEEVKSEEQEDCEVPGMDESKDMYAWRRLRNQVRHEEPYSSQQERLQRMETEFLESNYFVRRDPQPLADATINTSVREEIADIEDHIIVICKDLTNLKELILQLRARKNNWLKYIVVLSQEEIPPIIWQTLSIFEGILSVLGSPLEESDLVRAGVHSARQVVILADIEAHTAEPGAAGTARHGLASSVEHDVLVDANAILTYQCVKRLNEKCHVLIEIVRDQNIHFLDAENFRVDYKLSPYFASGTIFTSSLFDTLLVQSFYNPDIINVVNKLVGAELKTGPNGDIPVTRNNQEGETNATLQNGMQNPFSYHSSKLYQMSLPEGLESRTYGALFKKLAKTGKIPLGLIRGIFGHMNQGSRGNFLRYSFTNPPADCEIFSCDSVVVLSQNPPSQYIAGKPLSNAQMLREIHAQENLRLAKKKGNGDSYLNHVNREVKRMVDSHTHFKDCINGTRAKILSGLSSLHMEARAIEKALLKAGGGFSGTDRKPDENKSILQFKETSGSGSGGGGSSSGGSGAQMDHLPDADAHPAAAIKKPTKGEKLANTLDTMTGRLVRGSGL